MEKIQIARKPRKSSRFNKNSIRNPGNGKSPAQEVFLQAELLYKFEQMFNKPRWTTTIF